MYSVTYLIILGGRIHIFSFEQQLDLLLKISLLFIGGDTLVFIANCGMYGMYRT
jgi:hypothetical protein